MLTNVPTAINRTLRNVLINHPNTCSCEVYRKVVTRPGGAGSPPTLGGLGVLDSMDEEQFEYEFLGRGLAMPAEGGSFAPAPMVRRGDANIGAEDVFRYAVVPEEPEGQPGWFSLRTHDVLYLLLGTGPSPPKLAFEVLGEETTSNIPPFTTRYITARRDDLHVPAGE